MQISFIDSIHKIQASEWDSLCPPDYPFIRHAFFTALEDSQSTNNKNGWQVSHLICTEDQQLIAAMPGYIKTHSYGEYVFDWSWADAYKRHGKNYYPKWINAIPFTPCTGPRLLISKTHDNQLITRNIADFLKQSCEQYQLSGWHCLFPDTDLHQAFELESIPERIGCQFHWFNSGYINFEDFLSKLNSRKRKTIKKERQSIIDQGIHFQHKSGKDLKPGDANQFYSLYRNTYYKRSGHSGYLTQAFFEQLFSTMADNLLLIEAIKSDTSQLIAASLFVKDSQTLYGRYWGCNEEYPLLHFETCYYQGIDYVIAKQLQRFDGGAQGEHKIPRGFQPTFTWSHHWIHDENFRPAIQHFLQQEAAAVNAYAEEAAEFLPFKKDE